MRINLYSCGGEAYFEIITDHDIYYTSQEIANFLNLNLDTYNKLLIDKVIQCSDYYVDKFPDLTLDSKKDISFSLNNISKETYVERFKDAFTNQLTLLALGGESIEN